MTTINDGSDKAKPDLVEFNSTTEPNKLYSIECDSQKSEPVLITESVPELNNTMPTQDSEPEYLESKNVLSINETDANLDFMLNLFPVNNSLEQSFTGSSSDENEFDKIKNDIQDTPVTPEMAKKK
ncbi:hypothetical protein A6046_00310 [[Haemophilus] ducreyi]|uniref:Uncharacterized protein n=2 Tax=Haemophilus ducreyi TaxID=730 RepID=Q7VMG4_HAEDU|nr:hypothetical protein [[Haemophilus] ducreyi]AAP95892.1 hypothetical protein HD_1014 [[Haemophilus] ducreyi 35000HP]AKO30908.1 hypothetical protein RY60_04040 [[Haemophilus] ducreyi]AKO32347.1 hypothetical protein RZ57_04050 [[Haemophilus] ducreyi]AKO33801.1 hypothetical protein RZ58_04065 [[Haemophilus] ducreyi]AKO36682.1 hypothetical protein RZ61_04070 [[Haemophilus] ducreyi]